MRTDSINNWQPKIVIQTLTTEWTYATRGEPGAEKRNSLPETMSIPDELVWQQNAGYLHHAVLFGEQHLFNPIEDIFTSSDSEELRLEFLRIIRKKNGVDIRFDAQNMVEIPGTYQIIRDEISFATGQWAQIKYNMRQRKFEDVWSFQKQVVNIGLYDDLSANLFRKNEPAAIHTCLAKHWD